ncbi:TetR/AcrR family transcriptional regulator [Nonomuraea sp. NPDC049309]|uniref:TetR/AcrR family transcriptional regulator n=1 Tax=Nonomuraea sp. NPDC049309 TaxID=3364350 RepID=UPI003720338B
MSRRTPTGAAVLQPQVTEAITEAVLDELAEHGYARLSMEGVAKRAGVGKSALYRRWKSKQEMAMAVIRDYSIAMIKVSDTGTLRGDLRASLEAVARWLTHPRFASILPDLVAEMARNPELGEVVGLLVGEPKRERTAEIFRRAIARGELPEDTDIELALDLIAAPVYWRLAVRAAEAGPSYLDDLTDTLLRALRATPSEGRG